MKTALLFITLFYYSFNSVAQTCVIAKISLNNKDTCIVIGADTRGTNYFRDKKTGKYHDTTYSSIHKVFTIGTINYATIGHNINVQKKIIDSLCGLHLTIDEIVSQYMNQYAAETQIELADIKKESLQDYNDILKRNTLSLSHTIFAGFYAGAPFIIDVIFIIDGDKVKYSFRTRETTAGGEIQEIVPLLNDKKTWDDDPIIVIRKLLKSSANYHPNTVSLPFEFLVIRKNSVQKQVYTQY